MKDIYLFEYLDTNGNGTGSTNAIGNYSVTPDDFYYEASSPCNIERMIISVRDTGAFDAADYGNGLALSNGIRVLVYDAAQDTDIYLDGGIAITSNAAWGGLCYDVDLKTWGAGDEIMLVRWTLSRAGVPLKLDTGDQLIVRLNDDFSGLVTHQFHIQGHKT